MCKVLTYFIVVTKDIPDNVLAVGNSCRVFRSITEEKNLTENFSFAGKRIVGKYKMVILKKKNKWSIIVGNERAVLFKIEKRRKSMKTWKKSLKRVLAVALAGVMVISIPELSAIASANTETSGEVVETTENKQNLEPEETIVYEEIVDLGMIETSAYAISLFGTEGNSVTLKDGHYQKWIDRINVPEYAIELYDKFVEGSDNDGVDDVLMDGSTEIEVVTLEFAEDPLTSGEADKVFATMRAVYDAFDRDHPEVFWLSGKSQASYSWSSTDETYQVTFYFLLKTEGYDVRAKEYTDISTIQTAIAQRNAAVETIVDGTEATDTVELIEYFNEWLIKHNEYSTTVAAGGNSVASSHECLSALIGSIGANGPVCEGYARAFKVLCDEVNIPCVLVDGLGNGGAHMWNNVRVDGTWYAADVTWNDPTGGKSGAVSGYENASWLLLGSNEFNSTHIIQNTASNGGVAFTNGPVLSNTNYVGALIKDVTITNSTVTYGYTTSPSVSVTLDSSATDTATYQWYKKGESDTEVANATSNTLPTGLDAGTYYCQVKCGEAVKNSGDVVVNKAELIPTISGSVEKTYDGTTEITEAISTTLSIELEGLVDGDVVSVESVTYAYTDVNAGANIAVNATNLQLSGSDVDNYYISEDAIITANVGTIKKLNITTLDVGLKNSELKYTGQPQTVEVVWGDSRYELVEGTDYTVSDTTQTEVGNDYKAIVTGKGNYEGTKELSFAIEYQSMDMESIKYNGADKVDMYNKDVVITADGYTMSTSQTGTFENEYTVSDEGSNNVVLYFKENATGYITDKIELTVYIDKTAPSFEEENSGIHISDNIWKTLANKITFGLFFHQTQDVSIYAEDSGSGVMEYYYYIDESGSESVMSAEELDKLTFTKGATCSIEKEGNHVVYAYAVDKAGNKSNYICSEGVVIDKTAPEISEIVEPSKKDKTLTDNSAKISFTGSEAGNYYYVVSKTDLSAEEVVAQGKEMDMKADDSNEISVTDLSANSSYQVLIAAKDKAGNLSEVSIVKFTTCKTLPVFETIPTITGTYGQTLGEMKLEGATTSSNNITGKWELYSEKDADVMLQAGTTDSYKVVFIPNDSEQYENVVEEVVPNVAKKDITATITNVSKKFGDENPTLDFTVSSDALVKGDEKSDLSITLSTDATKTSDVGTYNITGSANAANYNVTVVAGTLTITQAEAPTIASLEKNYIYTLGSDEKAVSIDIAKLLPTDRGTTTYAYTSTGDILSEVAVDAGILTYKVAKGNVNATASVTITAQSKNYKDMTVVVNVTLTDKTPIALQEGSKVEIADGNTLTYGEKLSALSFADVVFETADGEEVAGTLAWVEPDAILDAGTESVQWIFTPTRSDKYIGTNGNVLITVEKATPNITAPTTEGMTYNPAITLKDIVINGADGSWTVGDTKAAVNGTWKWKDTTIVPTVGNNGYTAVFTPEDTVNYNLVEKTVAVEVAKATPVVKVAPIASDIIHGSTLADSKLTGGEVVYATGSDVAVAGTFVWKDASITPKAADSNVTEYEVVFTPTDSANYNIVTCKVTLVVEKQEWPFNTPEAKAEVDYDTAKVSNIELPEGWEWTEEAASTELKLGEEVIVTAQYVADDKDNFKNTIVEIKVIRQAKAPYIEGNEGTMGWDAIKEEIKETPNAETRVDMNGFTEVDTNVLKQLKETPDATVVLVFENGLTWTIKGSEIEDEEFDNYINMSAELFEKEDDQKPNIPQNLIDGIAKSKDYKFLSLKHNGKFGFKAVLTLQLGEENAGKTVTIYYYDEANAKMAEPVSYIAEAGGIVKYAFTHASDYVITIEETSEEPSNPQNPSIPETPNTPEEKPSGDKTSPDTGYYNILLYLAGLLSAISVISIVFVKKIRK